MPFNPEHANSLRVLLLAVELLVCLPRKPPL